MNKSGRGQHTGTRCRGGLVAPRRARPAASDHPGREWPGIHFQALWPAGLPQRCGPGLQPSRKAHEQRFHRVIQQEIQAGVPRRKLVPVPGGCKGKSGIMARPLQWRAAPQRPGEPVPEGVRRAVGNSGLTRKTRTMAGTGNGAASNYARPKMEGGTTTGERSFLVIVLHFHPGTEAVIGLV